MRRYLIIIIMCAPAFQLGCGHPFTPIDSPSGRFQLNATDEDGLVGFKVVDRQRKTSYRTTTRASRRMRWGFEWDNKDRLWLDSSDVGTYFYEIDSDGVWNMYVYDEVKKRDGIVPPKKTAAHLQEIENMMGKSKTY